MTHRAAKRKQKASNEPSLQSIKDKQEAERRKAERGSQFDIIKERLQALAGLFGQPLTREFLRECLQELIQKKLINPRNKPDRVAKRYRVAFICWFCHHPKFIEVLTPPLVETTSEHDSDYSFKDYEPNEHGDYFFP
jgi:hypothetical protein